MPTRHAAALTDDRRQVGKSVSKDEYEASQRRIAVFRKWFNDAIVPSNHSRDSWTAVVLPVDGQAPRYRDEPLSG